MRKLPELGTLPDVTGPVFSLLAALRLAATDSPSLREVAREMGVSAQLLSAFECGRGDLSPSNLAKYSKVVGRDVADVRARWLRAAYTFHTSRAKDYRDELLELNGKSRRGKRLPKAIRG